MHCTSATPKATFLKQQYTTYSSIVHHRSIVNISHIVQSQPYRWPIAMLHFPIARLPLNMSVNNLWCGFADGSHMILTCTFFAQKHFRDRPINQTQRFRYRSIKQNKALRYQAMKQNKKEFSRRCFHITYFSTGPSAKREDSATGPLIKTKRFATGSISNKAIPNHEFQPLGISSSLHW